MERLVCLYEDYFELNKNTNQAYGSSRVKAAQGYVETYFKLNKNQQKKIIIRS